MLDEIEHILNNLDEDDLYIVKKIAHEENMAIDDTLAWLIKEGILKRAVKTKASTGIEDSKTSTFHRWDESVGYKTEG